MNINHIRIDDRLIHGQITTAWITDAKANKILLADDKAATDSMQQMILKLALPSTVSLEIKTISESAQMIADSTSHGEYLLILRNPESAFKLIQAGYHPDHINVGNISNSKSKVGRTRLLKNIFVEPDDVKYLKLIAESGTKLEIRAVPTDKPIDCIELLAKFSL